VLWRHERRGRWRAERHALVRQLDDARAQAHTDRLASLGELSAGIAHEINNPLTYLLASLHVLERRLGATTGAAASGATTSDLLRDAREGAERVRAIVHDIRQFASGAELERGPVDLRDVLASSTRLTAAQLRPHARLVIDIAGDLPLVEGHFGLLTQVVVNLLLNASQAIASRPRERDEIRLSAHPAGAAVILAVEDTGPGIPEAVLRRLFDPFFTTKQPGTGIGLGLSLCYGIVTRHGGTLRAQNLASGGARFEVILPERGATPSWGPSLERGAERNGNQPVS
jgi:C4-dicarboxylate-specific signal transduction histidine kinase